MSEPSWCEDTQMKAWALEVLTKEEPPPFHSSLRDAYHRSVVKKLSIIEDLERRIAEVKISMGKDLATLSPQRLVPPEILSYIFELAFNDVDLKKRIRQPKVTAVCRTWRSVALSSPRLWCNISLFPSPQLGSNGSDPVVENVSDAIGHHFKWMKGLQYSVSLDFSRYMKIYFPAEWAGIPDLGRLTQDGIDEMASALLPHVTECESYTECSPSPVFLATIAKLHAHGLDNGFRNLQQLHLTASGPLRNWRTLPHLEYPSLRALKLMNWPFTGIIAFRKSQITRLELLGHNVEAPILSQYIVSLVEALPSLESLVISQGFKDHRLDNGRLPEHHKLRSLAIDAERDNWAVLTLPFVYVENVTLRKPTFMPDWFRLDQRSNPGVASTKRLTLEFENSIVMGRGVCEQVFGSYCNIRQLVLNAPSTSQSVDHAPPHVLESCVYECLADDNEGVPAYFPCLQHLRIQDLLIEIHRVLDAARVRWGHAQRKGSRSFTVSVIGCYEWEFELQDTNNSRGWQTFPDVSELEWPELKAAFP